MSIALFEFTFDDDKSDPSAIQLLAIYPRDAAEKKEPCAWVFVRRGEKCKFRLGTNFVEEASIIVSYQAASAHRGLMRGASGTSQASYSQFYNRISLTGLSLNGRGGILVNGALRGMRFGTYAFNIIVGWAKQWPTAEINSIGLSEVDAYSENRERRNRFYEQFGLVFVYTDEQRKSGSSRPMPARDLQQVTTWEQQTSG